MSGTGVFIESMRTNSSRFRSDLIKNPVAGNSVQPFSFCAESQQHDQTEEENKRSWTQTDVVDRRRRYPRLSDATDTSQDRKNHSRPMWQRDPAVRLLRPDRWHFYGLHYPSAAHSFRMTVFAVFATWSICRICRTPYSTNIRSTLIRFSRCPFSDQKSMNLECPVVHADFD